MKEISTPVLVIGGGVMGTSTALHLARRGLKPLLLERGVVGAQASGVNFGNLRRQGGFVPMLPLAMRSRQLWGELLSVVGDCEFVVRGHIKLALDDEHMREMERFEPIGRQYGLELQLLDTAELRRRFPWVGPDIVGASFQPDDGSINPRLVGLQFARAARRFGADIVEGQQLREIAHDGSRFVAETAQGLRVRADAVVNAAGAWAGKISSAFGEPVPLHAAGPQMGVTEPLPYFIEPVVSVVSRSVYMRQVSRGNVVFGGGTRGPADNVANRAYVLPEHTVRQMGQLCRLAPALRGAVLIRVWSGVEGFLPDKNPIIGKSEKQQGLYHAFGFSGHGMQAGPAVGAIISDLILDGSTETPIEPFCIGRFKDYEAKEASWLFEAADPKRNSSSHQPAR